MKKKETRKKGSALVKSNENGVEQSYTAWIANLKRRYRATQIKAAVAVNSALIEFHWNLGKDISEKYPGKKRDVGFFHKLSMDLQHEIPDATGLSVTNIKYARYFFELYSAMPYRPQVADDTGRCMYRQQVADGMSPSPYHQQVADDKVSQMLHQLVDQLICVPWGHHMLIIDKCKGDREKALFYVRRTIQNGWSRNSLLNWLSTDLYEREGKAQTNFELTMPSDDCDLARHICSALAFARLGALESCAPLPRRLRARDTSRQRRAVSRRKLFVCMSKEIAYNSKVAVCNIRQSMV